MPSSSKKKDAAWTFADWATNKEYIKLVGQKLGWAHVPPGTRTSTYSIPEYQQAAGAFAQVTLDSIAHADVAHPTVQPVPYVGVQYVDIDRSEEHTSELQSHSDLVCRLLLEKKKTTHTTS